MYLEKRLEQLALNDLQTKKLFGIWCVLREQFIQMLDGVSQYFPHFSLHNETHSKNIAVQIERVLGKDRIDKLSASDIWLLLMSFYSHDIGMALKYEEVLSFFKDDNCEKCLIDYASSKNKDIAEAATRLMCFGTIANNNNYEQSIQHFNDMRLIIETHFRGIHATKSKKYIDMLMESFNKYSTINIRFVELLGEICLSHQQSISNILALPYETNGLVDDYAHPRFIAGMLNLGDLLDLDTDRFNESMLEVVDPLPESSKIHQSKHKSIKHFLVNIDGIEIVSDTEDDKVNRELRTWTQYLQETVEYLCLNWTDIAPRDFGMPPKINNIKHYKNGNENWSNLLSLAFTIDKNRAMELLQGANIYNSKFIFVREVIQNAIDASILQMWYELHNSNPQKYNSSTSITEVNKSEFDRYPINIDVTVDKEGFCIFNIQDKGIGIDSNDLINISNVGNSNISKKKEILNIIPKWLKPSGAFGLGLQSIFMVADSFEAISKTDNDQPKVIKFESGNYDYGYISVSDYKGYFPRGTKITIKIDNKKLNMSDVSGGYSKLVLKFKTFGTLVAESIYHSFFRFYSFNQGEKIYKYSFFNINFKANILDSEVIEETMNDDQGHLYIKINQPFNHERFFTFLYYDNEYDTLCELNIIKPYSKDKNNECIQFIRSSNSNSIYFRNSFIDDYLFRDNFKKELYKYIRYSINILNYNSSELLNISRKSFTKEGRIIAQNLIETIIKRTLKRYIDKILAFEIDLEEYVICFFQICKYLDYRTNEFYIKFVKQLERYQYGAFTSYKFSKSLFESNAKNDISYKFSELIGDKDYIVVINRYPKLSIVESLFETLPLISNIDESLQNHNIYKFYSENVISNKIMDKCFMQYDDFIYECFKIKPLFICDYQLPSLDSLNKIQLYINAIMNNHRTIEGDRNFEDLCLIEGESEYASYRIELPFTQKEFELLKNNLQLRMNNSFEKEKFIVEIKKNMYYKAIVSYINEQNNKDIRDIELQMIRFLNEMLELLFENELFKECVINIVTGKQKILLDTSQYI